MKKVQTTDADGHFVEEYVKEETPQAPGAGYWRNGKFVETGSATQVRNGQIVSAEPARRGVVGSLEEQEGLKLSGMDTTLETAKAIEAQFIEFSARYPQVISTTGTEDCNQNGLKIAQWFKARNASFTFANLVKCFHDIFDQLVFDPSVIGLEKYGTRIAGAEAIRKMPSSDYEQMLKPHTVREKNHRDMNSAEYKAAELVKDPKVFVVNPTAQDNVEINAMKEAIANFFSMRPSYIANEDNKAALLTYIAEHNLRLTFNSLCEAFDSLTKSGDMAVNTAAHSVDGGTKADYALAAGARPRGVARFTKESLNKLMDSLSADAYWQKYRTTASFRAAVDSLG